MSQPHIVSVLLVDDNPGDRTLTRLALERNRLAYEAMFFEATGGRDCLDFLYRRGRHAAATRPDLILLDLNMPDMNGEEVLHAIKSDDNLKSIPVVILTSSDRDQDVDRSYALQASCYIRKPVDMTSIHTVISKLSEFWFAIVRFPPT